MSSHASEHKSMGFGVAKAGKIARAPTISRRTMPTIQSGFTQKHNFGCDHAQAHLPKSPSVALGANRK